MMLRRLCLFVFIAGLAGAAQAQEPLDGFDAFVERAMAEWRVPGLAVAVVKGGDLVFAKGYGVRRMGALEAVDEHTVFAVASNSKAVTATALGLLVEAGRLDWDDRVRAYLPTLQLYDPYVTEQLTVRDLLSHRVGHATWAGDLLWYGSDLRRDEVLARVRYVPPAFDFRGGYGYSNLMYVAAGQLIPALTDSSWDQFVAARFFEPLGMARTTTNLDDLALLDNVAQPHTLVEGEVRPVAYRHLDAAAAVGGINSSARDWAQWLRLQLGHGTVGGQVLVDSAIVAETRQPHNAIPMGETTQRLFPMTHLMAYGLGWGLRDYRGRLLVTHSGGMDGMLSRTGFLPEENLAVAVFTNYDEHSLYNVLFYDLVDRFLGAPDRDWNEAFRALWSDDGEEPPEPMAGTQPSLPLAGYAGTYVHNILGEVNIREEDGQLVLTFPRHEGLSGPLRHWHYDTFEARWDDPYFRTSLITFSLDARGEVEHFRVKIRPDFVDPLAYTFARAP